MDLKNGKIIIAGILLDSYMTLQAFINMVDNSIIKVLRLDNMVVGVNFKTPQKIGSKLFNVGMIFRDERLSSIDLSINDKTIDEFDYLKRVDEGSDWLVENIGYPQGILTDNKYEWGMITQWDDARSASAGITIIYYYRSIYRGCKDIYI